MSLPKKLDPERVGELAWKKWFKGEVPELSMPGGIARDAMLAAFKAFKLDPTNPEKYIREKREAIAALEGEGE